MPAKPATWGPPRVRFAAEEIEAGRRLLRWVSPDESREYRVIGTTKKRATLKDPLGRHRVVEKEDVADSAWWELI